ncbi:MAG: zinc ribbon domain-containing protein, partial [Phycisphaerae bacterium]|nr:zinc ribbon domain-containing protein [Phycisphaerae bacterium]
MPTYEYVCEACKHRFERFQSMTAAPVKVCPECGKRTVKRLIGTGAALLFKGSGFYITDYRSEGYKKKAEADKPSAAGGSAGESGSASPPASSAATAQTPAAKAG